MRFIASLHHALPVRNLALSRRRILLSLCGAAALFFVLGRPGTALAQTRHIELGDFVKLVRASDPEISPDGKTIAFVVTRADTANDRYDRELYLLDVGGGTPRQLTHGRLGVASPQWSPSGDRLAFLAPAGPEGKQREQLFVLPMKGGEALQITKADNGVEQFAWRPGGKDIAYVTADDPPNKKAIEKHDDAFEVGDNGYLARAAPTPSHLWLVPASGDSARRLTSGAWSLPKSHPPGPPASPLSWSPDGRFLLFTRQADPHFGDIDQSTLQVLDVRTDSIRPLTDHDKFEADGLYSPDGSRVAYQYPSRGDPNRGTAIYVTPATGGAGRDVTHALDRNIARGIWMPDGKSLLVGAHDATRTAFWIQPLSGAARKLDLGDVDPSWSFWIDASVGKDGAIAFTGSEPGRPTELYYLSSPGATPKRLTDFNHDIAALDLGRTETFTWQGPNRLHEDGVVVYPPGFSADHKYPLVLVIHGGPTAATTTGFSILAQLIAAQGFVVFQPNYRGSDNLGNAYQTAIVDDAGDGPGRDVMAGIAALEKRGFVDTARIAVSGWSYGGYMTTWLIGHYHIWKTAIAGAPVTNVVDQYNLADFNVLDRYGFLGSPWTSEGHMGRYREQSPITYAPKVTTPTLLLHDVGDPRVTITQSYEFYHALKDNGVTVRFFAYPTGGHFPSDPVRQTDVFRRWTSWLKDYLQ
jgi:dipeptidyl aminopeptidase/acylaminoacyl peptidase